VQSSSLVSTSTILNTSVQKNDSQSADVEIDLTLDVSGVLLTGEPSGP